MTQGDDVLYKVYLAKMSHDDLATETKTVLLQDAQRYPDTARLIQHCVNEYERRGIKDTFLTVYNEAIS